MIKREAEELIGTFFLAFPQFRKWLNDTPDPNATLDVWCRTLEPVDQREAAAIVEEMSNGVFPVPAGYERDQLAIKIRREALDRAAERERKQTQRDKYHNQAKGAWDKIANDRVGHIAIELGVAVREGRITSEENATRLEELLAWDKGGPKPAWVE